MGIISKTVKVFPRGKSVSYYKEKGYDTKYEEELEVKVQDLSTCSTTLILVSCDYCGKLIEPMRYVDYNRQTKNGTKKCCCSDCVSLKREETMLEKYGHRNALQVPEIKEKIQSKKQKKTLMKNYGVENPSLSKEIQEKRKQTFIDRYGVENPLLNQEIRWKATQTILDRYGVENVFFNKEIRDKRNMTLVERYGTLYPLQNEECFEKMKKTNMEKYGAEFIPQLEETKQKVKQTSLKKYGVENPFQSEEVQEKIKKTNMEKYGVECLLSLPSFHKRSREIEMERYGVYHHLQNPEILAKQKETFYKNGTCPTSKQQNYLHKLYGGELNYCLKMYNLDIYLPNEKINIEFDGSGHSLGVKRGNITQEEFDRKEIIRNNTIKRENIKQMRIISPNDKLPSDDILLQMLQDARQYFSDCPSHSWIEFNISTSSIRSAEYKDGVFYNYGELHTVKEIV